MPKAHPLAIGAAIVSPSAVSHWSALQHWELTEQVPTTVMLSSTARTFPPADEADGASKRPAWTVAGVRYEFVTITRPRFFGVTLVWVNERNQMPMFDRKDKWVVLQMGGNLDAQLLAQQLVELVDERMQIVAWQGWAKNGLEVQLPCVTVQVEDRIGETPRIPASQCRIDELRWRLRVSPRANSTSSEALRRPPTSHVSRTRRSHLVPPARRDQVGNALT